MMKYFSVVVVDKKASRRVKSLDAFRGLSVAMMVFVNYGGGGYYFFNHSPWDQCYKTFYYCNLQLLSVIS
jgi:predicted acyltransferase